eukprot:4421370-Alexandrium_andersonii.AAC.1
MTSRRPALGTMPSLSCRATPRRRPPSILCPPVSPEAGRAFPPTRGLMAPGRRRAPTCRRLSPRR